MPTPDLVDLLVPSMGESVKTATLSRWLKRVGDPVKVDEAVVSVDSDKATAELPSPATGTIVELLSPEGAELAIGQVIARIAVGVGAASAPQAPVASPTPGPAGPAVRAALTEAGLTTRDVTGTGRGGRILAGDVPSQRPATSPAPDAEPVDIVPMSTLRRRIAERMVQAQSTAAILTTFNEVDMSRVLALRAEHQDRFTKKYGTKLGFMSFFVKAAIDALQAYPSANAEIRGTDIVYKRYWHIGVAVSSPRGLVVPVIRHADRLSFAETEQAITTFGQRAKDATLTADDLQGGTFTISNGGTFGSMMSTPILNAPQVAILGMHAIQKRAMVVTVPPESGGGDAIVVRPMMYLALSYDHRLLDGREAVLTLVRIKECIENPERLLLGV